MSYNWEDSSYYQNVIRARKENEELTEEEKRKLELKQLGLTEEPEITIDEEEIALTEVQTEEEPDPEIVELEEEDSIWTRSAYYKKSKDKSLELKGKQLEYKGEAEGVSFYYDPDTKKNVTVHTRGYQLEDKQFANFPSLLPTGEVIYNTSPTTEKELFNFWLKNDPDKIEYFKTEAEAELAAKLKSKRHTEIGKRYNFLEGRKELTGEEAFELGGRLERHTLGNVGRLVEAGYRSFTDDIEFQSAIKEIEKERQEVIFEELQTKYGKDFRNREDDGRVTAGRITTAFFDPVTFVLPWAKAAKLGKIAATGFGAGVGVTDMAIYEYAAYGEVNPYSLAFGGTAGGLSSLGGKIIGDRMIAPKGTQYVDEPKITLTAKEADDADNVVTNLASNLKPILDDIEVMPSLTRQHANHSKNRRLYKEALSKYKNLTQGDKTQPDLFTPKYTQAAANKVIKEKYGISLKTLQKRSEEGKVFIQETYPKRLQQAVNGQLDLTEEGLIKLSREDKLTENLLTKILYETTRPLFGAGIGWGIGTFIDDDAEENNAFAYSLTGLGMMLGGLHTRIMKTPYINKGMKEKAFGILENQQGIALHNALKFYTAGSTASIANALGGPNKTLSNLLFTNQFGGQRSVRAAEATTDELERQFFRSINDDVIQGATQKQEEAAWWITRNLETDNQIVKKLNLTSEDLIQAKTIADNSKLITNSMSTYSRRAGIDYEEIDDWGLPQIYNFIGIKKHSNPKSIFIKASQAQWGKEKGKVIGTKLFNERMDDGTLWKGTLENPKFTGVPVLSHFHRQRQFTDPKAIKILANAGFLETNINTVLKKYVSSSIQGIEFGRVMGMQFKGYKANNDPRITYSVLDNLTNQLRNEYKKGILTEKDFIRKMKNLQTNVNLYFKKHGNVLWDSPLPKNAMSLLTFLGNSTMLTRSAIAQLGDLVQPFQNTSSIYSPVKALMKMSLSGKDFATKRGFQGRSTYEKDRVALFAGTDPDNKFQETLGKWNERLFKYNLMTPLTNFGERFAFNAGIFDAYSLAVKHGKKTKLSNSIIKQMNQFDLNKKDLRILSQFKTVDEAFEDSLGQRLLLRAGNKIKNRDLLLPTVGNRMHFAQSKDPFVRSLGMFLSWAQAKTTQMNSLVDRVQNGDVKLAIKMLGGITIFGGIRELQIAASPSVKYYEENEPDNWSPKWWQEALALSGSIPWSVEKVARAFSTNTGGTTMEGLTPVVSYVNKLGKTPTNVYKELEAEDYEGAIIKAVQPLPLARDIINVLNRLFGFDINNESNRSRSSQRRPQSNRPEYRRPNFEGGKVSDKYPVPNAPVIPMERKDRMGNQSYATQASAEPINPFTGEPYTAIYKR